MTRNCLMLWHKLPGPMLWRKAALWFLRQRLVQLIRLADDPPAAEALLARLWDGLRGVFGAYDPRRRIPWPLRPLPARHAASGVALLDGRLWPKRRSAG